jgi:hypothetical protein
MNQNISGQRENGKPVYGLGDAIKVVVMLAILAGAVALLADRWDWIEGWTFLGIFTALPGLAGLDRQQPHPPALHAPHPRTGWHSVRGTRIGAWPRAGGVYARRRTHPGRNRQADRSGYSASHDRPIGITRSGGWPDKRGNACR